MDEMPQEQFQPMDAPQQGVDPALLEQAKAMAQDPEFAGPLQYARENGKDFVTGMANAIVLLVSAMQKQHGLDDETALGPVLVQLIVGALEVADEAGDEEATPEAIDDIRDTVISMMGRMDAEMHAAEADEAEQAQAPQPPQGRLASMMGG